MESDRVNETVGLSCGEAAWMLMSTDVSAVWRDGGRLKRREPLVVMLPAVVLSAAVGVPEDADHPRILRVWIAGGYSKSSGSVVRAASQGVDAGPGDVKASPCSQGWQAS